MAISILGGGSAKKPEAAGDLIKETTTQTFVADVIEASRKVPVLVDFWAPWCGPCKQLTPVLEKVVKAARGAVRLVKMNIDDYPEVAGQLGVQSIPAVFAFKNGQPVDGFMGALPESQVNAFIQRLLGPGAAAGDAGMTGLEDAKAAFEAGDIGGAAAGFAAVLQADPESVDAVAGLAKCYIAAGDFVRAEQTLALVPPAKQTAEAYVSAKAALELAKKAGPKPDIAALEKAVAAAPRRLGRALQAGDRAERHGKAAGGDGPAFRDRAQGPRLERGRGPQAAHRVFRGLGRERPADARRAPAFVVAFVRVKAGIPAGRHTWV